MELTEAERLIQWQAKEIERLKQFEPCSNTYTVFCRECSDTGSTWIDVVTVEDPTLTGADLLKHIRKIAVESCAIDWGWEDSVDSIECYCVIRGEPGVMAFKDLS